MRSSGHTREHRPGTSSAKSLIGRSPSVVRPADPRPPAPPGLAPAPQVGTATGHSVGAGTDANARTGNVPKASIFGGTTVTRAPDSGSWPRLVRCSTTGTPAP